MMIKAITDNHGMTFDRYCVYFWEQSYCLGLSENCDSPQGFSIFGEHQVPHESFILSATNNIPVSNNEWLIDFNDLPKNVQKHVIEIFDEIEEEYNEVNDQ